MQVYCISACIKGPTVRNFELPHIRSIQFLYYNKNHENTKFINDSLVTNYMAYSICEPVNTLELLHHLSKYLKLSK